MLPLRLQIKQVGGFLRRFLLRAFAFAFRLAKAFRDVEVSLVSTVVGCPAVVSPGLLLHESKDAPELCIQVVQRMEAKGLQRLRLFGRSECQLSVMTCHEMFDLQGQRWGKVGNFFDFSIQDLDADQDVAEQPAFICLVES